MVVCEGALQAECADAHKGVTRDGEHYAVSEQMVVCEGALQIERADACEGVTRDGEFKPQAAEWRNAVRPMI